MPALPDQLQSKLPGTGLDEERLALITDLCARGQQHLFDAWTETGTNDDRKLALIEQLRQVHRNYPGGLGGYLDKVRLLLDEPATTKVSADTRIEKPALVDLTRHDDTYHDREKGGLGHLDSIAFALVAGGLGERLGHDDIKVGIPIEITAGTTYLQHYCTMIKAMEERANRQSGGSRITIPFFIMTSGGTRAQTVALLEGSDYFGLSADQVQIHEQHLVPAVGDRDGRLVLEDPWSLALKPNGHGDVHALIHQHGFAESARAMGKTHLVFIQDTNAQVTDLVLPALGTSLDRDYDFNFVCVPRIPAEPIGAVVEIHEGQSVRTEAVEYNVLDGFLKKIGGTGDHGDQSGHSPYPGSINLLVVKLDSYCDILRETGGAVAEFINPKYAAGSRTTFAKPTRIETLMQDLARSYPAGARIGATLFDRDWALAALKNNLETAAELATAGQPSYSATAAESAFYANGRIKLAAAGAEIESGGRITCHGIPFTRGAKVVLSPRFALTTGDAKPKLKNVFLGRDTSLVIDGEDVSLENVRLEGASSLLIRVCPGAILHVEGLTLTEDGNRFEAIPREELRKPGTPSVLALRGYRKVAGNPLRVDIDCPGRYHLGADRICRRLDSPPPPNPA